MTMESPKTSAPRGYTPADRDVASALLGDGRPLDAAGTHVYLSGEGAVDGLALWLEPPASVDEAYLGPVIAPGSGPSRQFYELVFACANDALAHGYERGYFTIKDRGLLRLLERTFRIDPVAVGWDPEGGTAREWEVHVEVRDAIEQLRNVVERLGGSSA